VYFDEARTNIYKLYRAARCGPDSTIRPEQQLAFYDPGLGTRSAGGLFTSLGRMIYNYVSQATGLGITHNIIDCYTAIIQLWRPGDRIFLFGFSRGAYTVRCLATALCLSGIPTQASKSQSLKRDEASARKLATRAVKTVYQHVSSPRDTQFLNQRTTLADQFRSGHACSEDQTAFPFFIGVFDTVAALSDRGALAVLASIYLAVLAAVSFALGRLTADSAIHWAAWIVLGTICVLVAAYIYTHLKFSFRLPGYRKRPTEGRATGQSNKIPPPHELTHNLGRQFSIWGASITLFITAEGLPHVRFGLRADIAACLRDVCFTPNSGRCERRT
jgi:hypothetical protein